MPEALAERAATFLYQECAVSLTGMIQNWVSRNPQIQPLNDYAGLEAVRRCNRGAAASPGRETHASAIRHGDLVVVLAEPAARYLGVAAPATAAGDAAASRRARPARPLLCLGSRRAMLKTWKFPESMR